jgi:halocyanin-like protein
VPLKHPLAVDSDVYAPRDATDEGTDAERPTPRTRRAVLGLAAGSLAGIAGCLGGGTQGYDDWVTSIGNYDGVVDMTGTERPTVAVGANGGLDFAPAAIAVDAGTTVVWEWTGRGSSHNVVERDGAFRSEYHVEQGATFEHTFEEAGEFAYFCEPHRGQGMKGGVEVR